MKKILLFSTIILASVACNNSTKTDAEETSQRDSMDNAVLDKNQAILDSIEAADNATPTDSAAHDHSHEGHDHDHSAPGHTH